jgi:alpha-L-rhamnosidase
MLRTEFVLPVGRIPASAVVHVVGLGQFQLRINGADVGGDANVPGWTTWAKRVLFSTYELPAGTLSASPAAK